MFFYCLLPDYIIFFCIFIFYVSIGVLLKGMVESCLLSEDELLTIGENWTSKFHGRDLFSAP